MSLRYKGAVISATPPTTTGGDTGTASGAWTLQQQMQAQAAGNWPTQPPPPYIEDVFSTYLYTGSGSPQTITNNIDISTKGALVWIKNRGVQNHFLTDTARGAAYSVSSNTTSAQSAQNNISAFTSSGFSLPDYNVQGSANDLNSPYASWSFAKQAKFFDVVTFTKSTSPQVISHNLGSVPGCIIIKRTDSTGAWLVAHRGYTGGITAGYTLLNTTATFTSSANAVTAADSTSFTLGSDVVSGNFVAYLFAHDAGGFGEAGTDNVISCGSYTGNGLDVGPTVTLGYEPQWLLVKAASDTGSWGIVDSMRGFTVNGVNITNPTLIANSSSAENTSSYFVANPTSTGFNVVGTNAISNASGVTYIYIAIRRPMKPPTSGTSVFQPVAYTGVGAPTTVNSSNQIDFYVGKRRGPTFSDNTIVQDRLRGSVPILVASDTRAEEQAYNTTFSRMTGIVFNVDDGATTTSGATYVNWGFTRKTQFMDEVCYTGTGATRTVTHNLGVAPELLIVKSRTSGVESWRVLQTGIPIQLRLNTTAAGTAPNSTVFGNDTDYVAPTASSFTVGSDGAVNGGGSNYVAYLFATLAGVSKVGSYTGTGGTQSINCGFTGGARFLLAKRTDSTGAWFCWDSARGFTSGSSPYLRWNDGASAETTGNNGTYASTGGFTLTSDSPVNDNGGSYIYLAIA